MGGEETILPYRRIPISDCRMNEGNRKSLWDPPMDTEISEQKCKEKQDSAVSEFLIKNKNLCISKRKLVTSYGET